MAMPVPKGTLDCDLQQGPVNGVFVLFDGHNMLKRHRKPEELVVIAFASARLTCTAS